MVLYISIIFYYSVINCLQSLLNCLQSSLKYMEGRIRVAYILHRGWQNTDLSFVCCPHEFAIIHVFKKSYIISDRIYKFSLLPAWSSWNRKLLNWATKEWKYVILLSACSLSYLFMIFMIKWWDFNILFRQWPVLIFYHFITRQFNLL
jgi:hypothetical protein